MSDKTSDDRTVLSARDARQGRIVLDSSGKRLLFLVGIGGVAAMIAITIVAGMF